MKPPLILASASPRRRRLLEDAGYPLDIDPAGIDEPDPAPGTHPQGHAALLAFQKALAVAARRDRGLILAADTLCAVGDQILNKPLDRDDAERMIQLQEGRDTQVITGLCLFRADDSLFVGAIETSIVHMRPLSQAERAAHLDSERWRGKAGAYGVQDDDPFVSVARGSFSNVVGLPMERLADLLATHPRLTR